MERNDSLLISASYFWSNTLNAFIFCHGPMTITLADVYMLTVLRITGPIQPYDFLSASSKKLAKISDRTGWASYILNHIGDGSTVAEREHVAFLNMWLVKALVWFWLIDETLSANLVYQSDYEIGSTTPSDEAISKIMMMVMAW